SAVRFARAGWRHARIRAPSPANHDWKYSVATRVTASISAADASPNEVYAIQVPLLLRSLDLDPERFSQRHGTAATYRARPLAHAPRSLRTGARIPRRDPSRWRRRGLETLLRARQPSRRYARRSLAHPRRSARPPRYGAQLGSPARCP